MTVTEALTILQPPLVFRDARQIAARRFLEQVEFAKDAARACKADHEWRTDTHKHAADAERVIVKCDCVASYAEDVRAAAASMLVAEWKK